MVSITESAIVLPRKLQSCLLWNFEAKNCSIERIRMDKCTEGWIILR